MQTHATHKPAAFALTALPEDLQLAISQCAGPRAAAKLAHANHAMHDVMQDAHLWRGFYQKHLGDAPPAAADGWPALFAKEATPKQRLRRAFDDALLALQTPPAAPAAPHAHAFLVTFPTHAESAALAEDYLAGLATQMGRTFRLADASCVESLENIHSLQPTDFCVIKHLDVIETRATMVLLQEFDGALHNADGPWVVALHADSDDTVDGAIWRRFPTHLACNIDPLAVRVDAQPAAT